MYDKFMAERFPPETAGTALGNGQASGPDADAGGMHAQQSSERQDPTTEVDVSINGSLSGQRGSHLEGSEDSLVTIPVPTRRQGKARRLQAAGNRPFDPVREGRWHADFPVSELTFADIMKASQTAAQEQLAAEQDGRVRWANTV